MTLIPNLSGTYPPGGGSVPPDFRRAADHVARWHLALVLPGFIAACQAWDHARRWAAATGGAPPPGAGRVEAWLITDVCVLVAIAVYLISGPAA